MKRIWVVARKELSAGPLSHLYRRGLFLGGGLLHPQHRRCPAPLSLDACSAALFGRSVDHAPMERGAAFRHPGGAADAAGTPGRTGPGQVPGCPAAGGAGPGPDFAAAHHGCPPGSPRLGAGRGRLSGGPAAGGGLYCHRSLCLVADRQSDRVFDRDGGHRRRVLSAGHYARHRAGGRSSGPRLAGPGDGQPF